MEFLVKDYAISIHPEHKSQIESSQLARCIADFIDNEKIKTLAKASAWLGNDETHYIRKHQNHNIQDLKRFIKATVAYIESPAIPRPLFAFTSITPIIFTLFGPFNLSTLSSPYLFL